LTLFLEKARTKLETVQKALEAFRDDQKAEVGKMMGGAIMVIVALVIISILGAALLPSAITTIIGTNTSTWDTGAVSMWSAITIFIVLVFLLIFVALALYVIKIATD